jgi:hypothetical protein
LNPPWPNSAEASSLRFVLPVGGLWPRALAAACLFAVGLALWGLAPLPAAAVGLALVLAGQLVLWVRSQTIAPGGATPKHEDVWAPVEDDWLKHVLELERSGERWDTTPWDVSNRIGCLALLALLGATAAAVFVTAGELGPGSAARVGIAAVFLFLPLWMNGMRTTWNPSELRKKGEALALAREAAAKAIGADFDVVPTLALREGRRGKYPVDARLMLRPAREDASGFLGVQIQVALNNVQGTDYPYLYAVILGKGEFVLPSVPSRRTVNDVDTVFEQGQGEGVRYLVVRQHADRSGGWHTGDPQIRGLVATALDLARAAWRDSARRTP